jgi:hypothetical protein
MLTSEQIIHNSLRTPDGTVLVSYNRHDYKIYEDPTSGKHYMVDGGNDYIRRSVVDDQVDLSQYYAPNDHAHNAAWLHWGTYGKDGKQPLVWKAVKDLDADHIRAILETQPQIGDYVRAIMTKEYELRGTH